LYELDFSGYKILGDGEFSTKVKIKADKVSSSAKEKIESLGGEIIIKESTKISKEIKKVKSS
jgi:ribosomal protein L15